MCVEFINNKLFFNNSGPNDNSINNAQTNTTTPVNDPDQQTSSLSNLLMDIGSSSPSTTSSLAVTSLATYASLGLDDQFEATTLSNSSSTATVVTTTSIPNSSQQTTVTGQNSPQTAIINSTNNTVATTNSQLPPVSTFLLPHFRDSSNYWWEGGSGCKTTTTTNSNYTGNNLQPMDDLSTNGNSNSSIYFSSLDQYSTSNGNVMSNNYDYQYNGYHTEATPAGEYSSGFTSLTSTLSN